MGLWIPGTPDIPTRKFNPRVDPFSKEAQFQSWLRNAALRLRWRYYHTHRSQRSEAGFPDTVLVRKTRLIFAELKTPWHPNPEPEQRAWLDALTYTQRNAPSQPTFPEVYLWNTWELDGILEVLK